MISTLCSILYLPSETCSPSSRPSLGQPPPLLERGELIFKTFNIDFYNFFNVYVYHPILGHPVRGCLCPVWSSCNSIFAVNVKYCILLILLGIHDDNIYHCIVLWVLYVLVMMISDKRQTCNDQDPCARERPTAFKKSLLATHVFYLTTVKSFHLFIILFVPSYKIYPS